MTELDDPRRYQELRSRIRGKYALDALYREVYARYGECVSRCPPGGGILEIGSGAGFAREVIPGVIASTSCRTPGSISCSMRDGCRLRPARFVRS